MAAAILSSSGLAGLHHPPLLADFIKSSRMYNTLKDDSEQPEVDVAHLQYLAKLFTHYEVQDIFGVHLVHGHLQIEEDTLMLGVSLEMDGTGYWTRPTKFTEIDQDGVHGHIYGLSSDYDFVAYEYREGPIANTEKRVNPDFFLQLVEYLRQNDLAGVLGLQVIGHGAALSEEMLEFVLDGKGTVMLRERDVNHGGIYRITGWSFKQNKDGTVSVSGAETHAETTKKTHRVFTSGKPLSTVTEVKNVLQEEGIL